MPPDPPLADDHASAATSTDHLSPSRRAALANGTPVNILCLLLFAVVLSVCSVLGELRNE